MTAARDDLRVRAHEGDLLERQLDRMAAALAISFPEQPLLAARAERVLGEAGCRSERRRRLDAFDAELRERLERTRDEAHVLARLVRGCDLMRMELDLLLLAAAPELDDAFGRTFAAAFGSRHATLGQALDLLERAFGPPQPSCFEPVRTWLRALRRRWRRRSDRPRPGGLSGRWPERTVLGRELVGGPLWHAGLLRAPADQGAVFERELIATGVLAAGLAGRPPHRLEHVLRVDLVPTDGAELERLHRPDLKDACVDCALWFARVERGLLHVATASTKAGHCYARAVAAELRLPLVRAFAAADADEAAWGEAALAALVQDALLLYEVPGDAVELRVPEGWRPRGAALCLTGPRTELAAPANVPVRREAPPIPRPAQQAAVWRSFLCETGGEARVGVLANRVDLDVADIRGIAAAAAARAHGRRPVHEDHARALRELVSEPASPLATTRRSELAWRDLVIETRTKAQLGETVRRVASRHLVQDEWGLDASGGRGRGVAVLLHGESGTGKTLAADAIASALDLPILMVDLARVVSKYVGETEKNLDRLFAEAEGFRALLLFDEADALFGKRTGVRDAHDRYANVEINFLLQRIEAFEGLVVLTTNLRQNLDDAFLRRLQYVVHLPRPGAAEREHIWRIHLRDARLSEGVDLAALARDFDLVGGDIKSAAETAAYAAAAAGGSLDLRLLEEAVRREYHKRGRPVPTLTRRT